MKMLGFIGNVLIVLTFCTHYAFSQSKTLQKVLTRGKLVCGVSEGIAGFSQKNSTNIWQGFDVDFCRAIATAIFNDPNRVEFVALNPQDRFNALSKENIDLLSRNTTLNLNAEVELPVQQSVITYYDGQGFLVKKSSGIRLTSQLSGLKICVVAQTTSQKNLQDFLNVEKIKSNILLFNTNIEAQDAFEKQKCDVLTTDKSFLNAQKQSLKNPSLYTVLPEVISREPLGPWVRDDDGEWNKFIKWIFYAMLSAEYLEINSQNIDFLIQNSQSPEVLNFIKNNLNQGFLTQLDGKWIYNIIKKVGNYSEIFERNLGPHTLLGLDRDLNKLWVNGGLMYAPKL